MVKKKIVLIGSTNLNGVPAGGEEYKNQLLVKLFKCDDFKLSIVDTYHWSRRPEVFLQLFYYILIYKSDYIVVSASSNSVYKLLSVIKFIRPNKLKSIIYFVLGGFLPGALQKEQFSITVYRGLHWIIVQGKQMRTLLNSLGLNNVIEIPNFKNTRIFLETSGNNHKNSRKLIFISTICKEKGVDLIFQAISLLKVQNNKVVHFEIDFYGPIEKTYEKTFADNLIKHSDVVKYCGYLDIMNNTQKSYSILERYEALVFPTLYEGEGFPGIFIDAFICGLPIITTNWHMNGEIIKNGINGLILKNNSAESLLISILKLLENPELSKVISLNNKKLSSEFDMMDIYESKISLLFTK